MLKFYITLESLELVKIKTSSKVQDFEFQLKWIFKVPPESFLYFHILSDFYTLSCSTNFICLFVCLFIFSTWKVLWSPPIDNTGNFA